MPDVLVPWERMSEWESEEDVFVQHSLGKFLRCNKHDSGLDFNGKGFKEKRSRWIMHVIERGKEIQLQSAYSHKYLRMKPDGSDFDVDGDPGSDDTVFIVEKQSPGIAFLQTKKAYRDNQRPYLGILDGEVPQKRLKFYEEPFARKWETPYEFDKKDAVVLMHTIQFKHLRVTPPNERKLDEGADDGSGGDELIDINGGKDEWSQWEADPEEQKDKEMRVRLKHVQTGGYLRIHGNDGDKLDGGGQGGKLTVFKVHQIEFDKNYVLLESVEFQGKYVAVSKDGPCVGDGGPDCPILFFRDRVDPEKEGNK